MHMLTAALAADAEWHTSQEAAQTLLIRGWG